MPQDQVLLTIFVVLFLANVLLLATIPLRTRAQRRSSQPERVRPGWPAGMDTPVARPAASDTRGSPAGLSDRGDLRDHEDARAAAAIEAFVAEVSADAAGRARPPTPSEVISRRREAVTVAAPEATFIPLRATPTDRPVADGPEPSPIVVPAQGFHVPEWTLAGLADPATWDRTVREESARVARFGRPVTVVMAELPHLDDVADRLGRDVADRVVTETARLLVSEGRAVDRIAWLGDARFGVLLLETEEIRACGYVDRVRAAADGWLQSAGLSIRLSLGWASPAEGRDLMAAAAIAQQRMRDAARRSSPGTALMFGA